MMQEIGRHQSHKNETLGGNVVWLRNKHMRQILDTKQNLKTSKKNGKIVDVLQTDAIRYLVNFSAIRKVRDQAIK